MLVRNYTQLLVKPNTKPLEGGTNLPDLVLPVKGRSRRAGNPICHRHGEVVSDAAVLKGRRDIWSQPQHSGDPGVHPRPAAKGKASSVLVRVPLSSLGVCHCLGFHLVHRTGIVLHPCWDGSLQPPSF